MYSQIDDYIDQYSDHRSIGQHSIWGPVAIVCVYIILVKKVGPWFMEKRKPFDIQKLVMLFDAIQVVANFYFVLAVIHILMSTQGSYFCLHLDSTDSYVGTTSLFLTKFYYWLKISDLLDTIFFVMRKSWRQVSYLHVYHHAVMILLSWMALKVAPGGHCAYFGLANSFVHTAMYMYYFLTAYDSSYKRNLTLKKFITQIQLVQFVFLIVIFGPSISSSCPFPSIVGIATLTQASYFLYLFGMFYYNSYVKISTGKRRQSVKSK